VGFRIARFIYDCPPPWFGLSPGPYEMSRAAVARGHAVTVFCGGWPSRRPVPIPGARIVLLPKSLKGAVFLTAAPALLARYFFHALFHRFDLVHAHAQLPQWYSLWRLVFGGRAPYFFHLHITFAGRREAEAAKRPGRWASLLNAMGRLSDDWGCRAAQHIFASSDAVKAEAVRFHGTAPEKITVVGNGVNTTLFQPAPRDEALAARLGLAPGDKVIVFVGNVTPRKNLINLVEALALLPADFKLVAVGSGDEKYRAEVEALAARLGVADRLRFGGYVDYPDLPPWYHLADVFALPSLYEGFPKVILEALACRKPCVVHEGYRIDEGIEAYLDKTDCRRPADLAQALAAAAGRGFKGDFAGYLASYSWDAITARMEEVYRRFLPGRG
jgi:glycosyltransferase involved in cell wall biosynthesis